MFRLNYLDLKGNPLSPHLQEAAGPCFSNRDCEQAARRVSLSLPHYIPLHMSLRNTLHSYLSIVNSISLTVKYTLRNYVSYLVDNWQRSKFGLHARVMKFRFERMDKDLSDETRDVQKNKFIYRNREPSIKPVFKKRFYWLNLTFLLRVMINPHQKTKNFQLFSYQSPTVRSRIEFSENHWQPLKFNFR